TPRLLTRAALLAATIRGYENRRLVMQEIIEETKAAEHEIEASEQNAHPHGPRPFRRKKRVIFIASALLALFVGAAFIYGRRAGRAACARAAGRIDTRV